jgi:hypothetical protein
MNTLINNGLKALTCASVAIVITAVSSVAFVQSTSVVRTGYNTPVAWTAKLSVQPVHAWFGQPEPAVLVD